MFAWIEDKESRDAVFPNFETIATRRDGKKISIAISAKRIIFNNKQALQLIITDITERNEFIQSIVKANTDWVATFNTINDAITIQDLDFNIMRANRAVEELLELPSKEIFGRKCYQIYHGLDHPHKMCPHQQALKTKESASTEFYEAHLNKFIEIKALPQRDENKNIFRIVHVVRDVTEQRQSLERLRETKDFLDKIIDGSLDSIVVADSNGYITRANKSFLKLLGYQSEEVLGKHMAEFFPTKMGCYECTTGEQVQIDEASFECSNNIFCKRLLNQGQVSNWQCYLVRKDNRVVPVEENIFSLYNDRHEQIGSVGTIRDITERKKAEAILKRSEEKYHKLIEHANDAIISINEQATVISFNKKAEEMFGYRCDEILGKSAYLLIPEGEREKQKEGLEKLKKTNLLRFSRKTLERKALRKDGSEFPIEFSPFAIEIEGEYVITAFIRDISEKKKAERELREAKEFLENVIESSWDGILIVDPMGNILSANKAMERITGYKKEEIVGHHASLFTVKDGEIRKRILEKTAELFEKGFTSYDSLHRTKDNRLIETECISSMIKNQAGEYIAGVSIIRDVSERKKMEQQLLQSEKLKSLGELAGGVAHDFNNVLAAILGRVQLLRANIEKPKAEPERRKSVQELKRGLEIVEKAAIDGAETVRRIQEFARKRDGDKYFTPVNLNTIIEDAIEFTKTRWKHKAESQGVSIVIQKELSPIPPIAGSASELREVFTNLINNACDAMPEGGCITIKTFSEDEKVVVSFQDNGIGIPKTIRDKIFDPFFTTKGVQSTGLGMSVSYGIITRHKGIISVDSIEGQGTTFTIKLPHSEAKASREEAQAEAKPVKRALILVIEDEKPVRDLLCDILKRDGHEVESACGGAEGLEKFRKKRFDLVFTDLGMPEMSGWQVAEEIKKINSSVPVALITGWEISLREEELMKRGIDLVANKPFRVEQVLSLVQEGMAMKEGLKNK